MVDQLSSYRNYVGGIRALLWFAGLWPSKKWDRKAYLVPFFNAATCLAMSLLVLNFCSDHLQDLDKLTKGVTITGSYLTAVLKVVCFLVNRKELVELHRTLEANFNEALANPTVRIIILDSLSVFSKPFFAITILLFIATFAILIAPIIIIIVQLSNDVHPIKYLLPYPTKYPWTVVGGGFSYYAHFAWQILAAIYLFCMTSGVDSLFGYYMNQIHVTFRLMSLRVRNLRFDDHDFASVIRDCVEKHRVLEKCRDHLQKIYGPIVLWIFLTSAVILCALIFQVLETKEITIGYVVTYVVYISLKLLQALMYAWYGSIIITESEDFREAVYSCDWPGSGDLSLMSNVLIILNQKPLALTACKFFIISTDMFTTIVNTTMSYFFLLQTLDEGT